MNTIRATMITAAMATMETVDTPRITRRFLSYGSHSKTLLSLKGIVPILTGERVFV
jgi:hypothetical protein